MSEMYICPKAKECTEVCSAKTPHEFENIGCAQRFNDVLDNCPSCIPYIPEYECTNPLLNRKDRAYACEGDCESCDDWQPKKPVCPECNGKGINPFKFPDAICPCGHPKSEHIGTYNCQHKDNEGYFTCLSYHCSRPADQPAERQVGMMPHLCVNPEGENNKFGECSMPEAIYNKCSKRFTDDVTCPSWKICFTDKELKERDQQVRQAAVKEVEEKLRADREKLQAVEGKLRKEEEKLQEFVEKVTGDELRLYLGYDDCENVRRYIRAMAQKGS